MSTNMKHHDPRSEQCYDCIHGSGLLTVHLCVKDNQILRAFVYLHLWGSALGPVESDKIREDDAFSETWTARKQDPIIYRIPDRCLMEDESVSVLDVLLGATAPHRTSTKTELLRRMYEIIDEYELVDVTSA